MVPQVGGEIPNMYNEFMFINGNWEKIGSSAVDLTDYVKNTDYATKDTAGVIKVDGNYGITISNGVLKLNGASNANIDNGTGSGAIMASNIKYAVKSAGAGHFALETDVSALLQRIEQLEA